MATEPDWRVSLLRAIGAPVNTANLRFLSNWQRWEGGHTNNPARYNWLNISVGAVNWRGPRYNVGPGIAIFPDYNTGVSQLATYLRGGQYRSVVRGLQSGNPYNATIRVGVLGDLSNWVSGSRTRRLDYGAKVLGDARGVPTGDKVPLSEKEPTKAGIPVLDWIWDESKREWRLVGYGAKGSGEFLKSLGFPDIFQPIQAVGEEGGPLGSAGDLFGWVSRNWDRALEVTGGFILLLVGLILLGRSLGVGAGRVRGPVGDVVNRIEFGPTVERAQGRPTRTVRVHEATDQGERRATRQARQTRTPTGAAAEEIPF